MTELASVNKTLFRTVCFAMILTGAVGGWLVSGWIPDGGMRSAGGLKSGNTAGGWQVNAREQAVIVILRRLADGDLPAGLELSDILKKPPVSSGVPMGVSPLGLPVP